MPQTRAKKNSLPPADPLAWMNPLQRRRHEELLKRLRVKPTPYGSHGFQILYVVDDENDEPEVMVWHPADADEEREIRAFYDAAHGLGAFTRPVPSGRPVRRTTDEQALIRTILANREETTGYLVYADYLTEHDDPQGEIIRLSVEMDLMAIGDTRYGDVEDRRDELVAEHAEHIYRGLADLGLQPILSIANEYEPMLWLSHTRGVIEEVTIDRPGVLPDNATRLFAAAPFLRKLEFERGHLDPKGLAKVKQLAQIEELELSGTDLTTDGLRSLLKSKYLTGLKRFDLGLNPLGDDGANVLAKWPGLARLESLNVQSCRLSPGGVQTLLASSAIGNLTRLRIGSNEDGTATTVFCAPHLTKLAELELGSTEISFMAATLGFASAAFANTLQTLDLDGARFQPGAFASFVQRCPPALRSLNLNSVDLRLPAASQLANAAFRDTLEELYLDNCNMGDAAANFFHQGKFPKLRTLDLSRNRLQRYPAETLAGAAKNFPALTNLKLWSNRLGPEAVAAFVGSKVVASLTDLNLSGNKIGPAGAIALAKSKHLKKLETLVVDEKACGKKGKKALLDRFGEDVVSFR